MAKEERFVSKRLYKITIGALKIIPMLLAFFSMLNIFFDFFGINSYFISALSGISALPLAFLYLISYVFQFCEYHRMFLHYILVSNLLVWYDYVVGIPLANRELFMLHVFVVGLFLFLVLYFYRKENVASN